MTRNNINKAIRSILGISGAELGRDIGYTRAAISMYNRGIGSPELQDRIERYIDKRVEECSDEVVKRICRYLQEEREHAIRYPALYY